MDENKANSEGRSVLITCPKNIEELNSAFCALNPCHTDRFQKAFRKIKGFGSIIIARNIDINGIMYWRSVTFKKTEENSINVSFPFLSKVGKDFVLKGSIAIFTSSNVGNTDVENLVGIISEAFIKENQI